MKKLINQKKVDLFGEMSIVCVDKSFLFGCYGIKLPTFKAEIDESKSALVIAETIDLFIPVPYWQMSLAGAC